MSVPPPEPPPPNNVSGTQNNVAHDQYNAAGDIISGPAELTKVQGNQYVDNQRTTNINLGANTQGQRMGCITVNVVVTMVSVLAVLAVSSFLILNSSIGAPNLRGVSVAGAVALRAPGVAAPPMQSRNIRGWAVGDRGAMFSYNGSDWKRYDGPVATNLNAIYYNGTDGWVVGDNGTVLRISANQSVAPTAKLGGNRLISVAATPGNINNVVASDDKGNVYITTDGRTWQPLVSATPNTRPPGILIPANGQVVIVRDDGSVEITSRNAPPTRSNNVITGSSPVIDLPIVAAAIPPPNITTNTLWAVGSKGSIYGYNGSNWNKQQSPTTANLNSIYFNNTTGWIVGSGGTILNWQDSRWQQVSSPTRDSLNSIYASDSEVWAVGNNGRILQWNGNAWIQRKLASNIPTPHTPIPQLCLTPIPCAKCC